MQTKIKNVANSAYIKDGGSLEGSSNKEIQFWGPKRANGKGEGTRAKLPRRYLDAVTPKTRLTLIQPLPYRTPNPKPQPLSLTQQPYQTQQYATPFFKQSLRILQVLAGLETRTKVWRQIIFGRPFSWHLSASKTYPWAPGKNSHPQALGNRMFWNWSGGVYLLLPIPSGMMDKNHGLVWLLEDSMSSDEHYKKSNRRERRRAQHFADFIESDRLHSDLKTIRFFCRFFHHEEKNGGSYTLSKLWKIDFWAGIK